MTKTKLLGLLTLLLFYTTGFAQGAYSFKINEVEHSAWIEIANTSFGTNDLRNCYITNSRNALNKQLSVPERIKMMTLIPSGDGRTNLKAKQCLIFFADSCNNKGTTHLGFGLKKGKANFIALFDGNGKTLLDSLTIPADLGTDEAFARTINPTDNSFSFVKIAGSLITPGRSNDINAAHKDKIAEFKEKDPYGIGMSVMGMGLVFTSLILLYIFFRIFGRIVASLERVNRFKAIVTMREQAHKATIIVKHGLDSKGVDKEIYAAVIAMALSEFEEEVHDIESGKITIQKKSTAWNSPSYGLSKRLHK